MRLRLATVNVLSSYEIVRNSGYFYALYGNETYGQEIHGNEIHGQETYG